MKDSNSKNIHNIITIDGPASSGKSTIAKKIAKDIGLSYIDTGAMYRAITLIALEGNIDLEDEKAILDKAKDYTIRLDSNASDPEKYTNIYLDDRDITMDIRSREVGEAVSIVSRLSGVRKFLVSLQRDLSEKQASVIEGRDTGSVVCPDAVCKIYLTADIDERVRRREKQLNVNRQGADKNQIKKEIESRDRIDSTRKDSPLVIPDNSRVIDTTGMSIEQVCDEIKNVYYGKIIEKRNKIKNPDCF
ncbi:MAG TPA: (d)CMP kinase [Actinobacteria bacterium]|nr:(d)CMP kinase [Actinomycetota bacterium]